MVADHEAIGKQTAHQLSLGRWGYVEAELNGLEAGEKMSVTAGAADAGN